MADHDRTDEAEDTAARAGGRRATEGANAIPRGTPEQDRPAARREAGEGAPVRGDHAEEAPAAAAGEPDFPALFGEDPGDIGQ